MPKKASERTSNPVDGAHKRTAGKNTKKPKNPVVVEKVRCVGCGRLFLVSAGRKDRKHCRPACRWKTWDKRHPRQKNPKSRAA